MKKGFTLLMGALMALVLSITVPRSSGQSLVRRKLDAARTGIVKPFSNPTTGTEALANIMAETNIIPLEIYPPGFIEGLQAIGDNPLTNTSSAKISIASSGMERNGPQGDGPDSPELTTNNYVAIDLGTLGGDSSIPNSMNAHGQVVGYSSTRSNDYEAFLYSEGKMRSIGLSPLNFSYGLGINDIGQVVCYTSDPARPTYIYHNGSVQYIRTELNDHYAVDINNNGQMIADNYPESVFYSNGSLQNIGTLGGTSSTAYRLNDSGQVVGDSSTADNKTHAFLYENGSIEDISGPLSSSSTAQGINASGQVVGYGSDAQGVFHGFLYTHGSMNYLQTSGNRFFPLAINSNGEIVGYTADMYGQTERASIYVSGSIYDLNSLVITTNSGLLARRAVAINSSGQITGYGNTPSGKMHAFLLNPVPLGWRTSLEATPIRRTYGTLPVRQSGKNKLILATHGWNPDMRWLREMTNDIGNYLGSHSLTDWQVADYEWTEGATVLFPWTALNNGKQDGKIVGDYIAQNGWTHVHLIAHSAGAGLIQAITEAIKSSTHADTEVHETFLDPYVDVPHEGVDSYGLNADWADNYFTVGDYPFTESLLAHAHNVDVSHLHKVIDYSMFTLSEITSPSPGCSITVPYHGWAHDFYTNTIVGNTTGEYQSYGFPLSEECGQWSGLTSSYPINNNPAVELGTPDASCISIPPTRDPQTMLNVAVQQADEIHSGDSTKYANGLKIVTHSPSWIALFINPTNSVNLVSFDVEFQSGAGSQGLLSVYWDAATIGSLDERAVKPGLQHYTLSFPQATANGSHVLGFRIDPFTNIQSVVVVTNIVLAQFGPSQSFSLAATTNINGKQIFKLTGEAGFVYKIETSTNLLNWDPFALLVNTNGAVSFFDSSSTNFSRRFYRAAVKY